MITKLAIKWITWQLRKDKSWWYSYQSNIAMAIYDNYQKYMPLTTGKSSPTLKEWCNICAKDFLNLWTGSKTTLYKRE
jgi:hypothetical protein